jgi:hypothetical protein
MKICNETLAILKNFASINTNIFFRQGNIISTISSADSIFARAKIKETIPNEIAVYDLNSLLATLTLIDNQNVEFEHNKLVISSDRGIFEYFFSSPDVVKKAPETTINHVSIFSFKLASEDIQMIMKAANVTKAPYISVVCKDQCVSLLVGDRKNNSSNNFKKSLGTAFNDFDMIFAVENFRVIPDAYDVTVARMESGKAKFLYLKHESRDLEYWIAADPTSTV